MANEPTTVSIEPDIRLRAEKHAKELKAKTESRMVEMDKDDTAHYLIYRVLGISDEEGRSIDRYQNKGRFLYKYAGSFLEDIVRLCFINKYPGSASVRIPNTIGRRPKTFEIDCLVDGKLALEIKWRDATTDGGHITKEHTRLKAVVEAGYRPIRVVFYYPNRTRAVRIQQALETLYHGVSGDYYYGESAWNYVRDTTGTDLGAALFRLGRKRNLSIG